MPLHYGKIFGIIALLTILAFVLWQLWIALFAGEAFDKKVAPPHAEGQRIEDLQTQLAAIEVNKLDRIIDLLEKRLPAKLAS